MDWKALDGVWVFLIGYCVRSSISDVSQSVRLQIKEIILVPLHLCVKLQDFKGNSYTWSGVVGKEWMEPYLTQRIPPLWAWSLFNGPTNRTLAQARMGGPRDLGKVKLWVVTGWFAEAQVIWCVEDYEDPKRPEPHADGQRP